MKQIIEKYNKNLARIYNKKASSYYMVMNSKQYEAFEKACKSLEKEGKFSD